MKNTALAFLFFGVFAVGCGEIPGSPGDVPSPLDAPKCTDVGAAQNCVSSPGHNGPSPTVTCQSNHGGAIVPIVGCTLDLLADPQTPYTALCVASCSDPVDQ